MSSFISSIKHKPEDSAGEASAILIQRTWRAGKNRIKDKYLTSEVRWDEVVLDARLEVARKAALEGSNSPRERWKRAALLVGRLRAQHPLYNHAGPISSVDEGYLKELEGQHWLELIDGKHRYGSNFQWYHRVWQLSDTRENFFKWLDSGEGKDISLNECPRERLESERIIYLSAEKRLNYLVTITGDGKLIWAKNNQPVDTTAGRWKDTEEGGGIVAEHLPTSGEGVSHWPIPEKDSGKTRLSSDDTQRNEATHYAGGEKGQHSWLRYLWSHLTLKGLGEQLLRKTVKKNTWIYITDKDFNLFIGIKETGYFQHSSFLAGGIVTSAGLIKVKNGEVRSISPLSGHYRTSVDHFKRFLADLEEKGVDLSRVNISKAEIALWGIEHIGMAKKKEQEVVKKGKEAVKNIPHDARRALGSKHAGSQDQG